MVDFSKFDNIIIMVEYFKDSESCKTFLKEQRWGDDVVCPHCGQHRCTSRKDGRFHCSKCGGNFSVTVGTIFENTKVSLKKWFIAMYLISSHKKGVSSHQLARDIKVTQKTAWFMLQRLRMLYGQELTILDEEVEADEAYVGGLEKYKHESKKTPNNQGRSLKTKEAVFGLVQRGGKLFAQQVQNTNTATITAIVKNTVKEGATMFTDEYYGYNELKNNDYIHFVVHHGVKEFVVGKAYTNTIEGFWAQLKRTIYGIYHFCSAKYLQRYIDECVYRYNTRKETEGKRFSDMFSKAIGVVRYEHIKMFEVAA